MAHLRLACRLGVATSLLLVGCVAPVPQPPSPAPAIALERVELGVPMEGTLLVKGTPGAVSGPDVTTVTLTVYRESPSRLQHLGHGTLPVVSSFARIAPDGSFGPVELGDAATAVRSGDELTLVPQAGTRQAGAAQSLRVP